MGFIKLEQAEVLKLATSQVSAKGWAVYLALRGHCYLPKKDEAWSVDRFMCFPSQQAIHTWLDWDALPAKKDGNGIHPSQPVGRAVKALIKCGMIRCYMGTDNGFEARMARKLMASKFGFTHKNGRGLSGGRQHVYHLIFWEELMRHQNCSPRPIIVDVSPPIIPETSGSSKLIGKVDEVNSIKSKNNNNVIIKEEENIESNLSSLRNWIQEDKAEPVEKMMKILYEFDCKDVIEEMEEWQDRTPEEDKIYREILYHHVSSKGLK
tara:strand:+ start:238 stop:1032 length:795 start_codon:yes stop_codon:yes gene_type:complete